MNYRIDNIGIDDILPIWKTKLWPNRMSAIESHSAMMITPGTYDAGNFLLPLWCYGCFDSEKLIGVNSSHLCTDGLLRIRGFWVDRDYRRKGVGRNLLEKSIDDARDRGIKGVWAYPRYTSWPIFESLGFKIVSVWEKSETSDANVYCYIDL